MANNKKLNKAGLPEGYDPYDIDLKKQIHPLADKKNFIEVRQNKPILCCGAQKRKKPRGELCRSRAGMGTDHPGSGRCKFCGGNNRYTSDPEKQARVKMNAKKHGFYSQALNAAERDTYEELLEKKSVGLEDEIFMLKAKILTYLKEKQLYYQGSGKAQRVYYKDGEEKASYRAGTIEDKPLTRALETLRRLVDSYAKLTGNDSSTILDQINVELRQASKDQAQNSWGGKAQERKEGGR